MTQAKITFKSFSDYLVYSAEQTSEERHYLVDGELVAVPPESEPNDFVADSLQFYLAMLQERPEGANASLIPRRLVKRKPTVVRCRCLYLSLAIRPIASLTW